VATSTITGTITGPTGTAVASARVVCQLMPTAGFRTADGSEVARSVETTTNASGVYSLVLERNSGISPVNTYYEITEYIPDAQGGRRVWTITVGASNQTVYASLTTPLATQSATYLDQASADARYQALGGLSSATPGTEVPDGAGTAGVSTSAQRADHIHPLPTSASTPAAVAVSGVGAAGATGAIARSQHIHAYNPPCCRVYDTTGTQTTANNTVTAVNFNSERYDTDTMHSTASLTSRITFTTAGVYLVTGHLELTADTDFTEFLLGIRLNGTTSIAIAELGTFDSAINPALSIATAYKFAAADYVELIVRQRNTSAGTNTIRASGNYGPEFTATWIGVG
jgi:hypothetical protein